MPAKRHKTAKRTLALHRRLGLRPPFLVLFDGGFVVDALAARIHLAEALPAVLLAPTKHLSSACSLHALRARQDATQTDFSAALLAMKRMERRRCPHTRAPTTSAHCIAAMVGQDNPHGYLVASQDPELRAKLRRIPNVPLLYVQRGVVMLEPPSPATLAAADAQDASKGAKQQAVMDVRRWMRMQGQEPQEEQDKSEHDAPRKRRRAQAPNPLSIKKKKQDKQENDKQGNEKPEEKDRAHRRKRRRRR